MRKILVLNLTNSSHYAEVPYLWLTLNSYYKRNSKNKDEWDWLDPVYSSFASCEEEIIDSIVQSNPDVLAISCYVWNDKLTLHIAEQVKKRLPDIRIIAGGPALYYESDMNWFKERWFIDAVCEYSGYGEIFITEYLDGTPLKDIPFCIYPSKNRSYWTKSKVEYQKRNFVYPMPYLDNVDYLQRMAKQTDKPIKIILETSRGCPYSCVYCEWGGGTASKVAFKQETEAYQDLKIALSLKPGYVDVLNANFGLVEEDVTLIRELINVNNSDGKFIQFINIYGPTKSTGSKKNLYKIYELLLDGGITFDFKLSVQHTNKQILDNIKRTDTPLESQLDLFKPLSIKYKKPLRIEGIIGLPGETLESFYQFVEDITVYEHIELLMHEWMMLPSAPSSSPEYINKMKIKTVKQKYINDMNSHILPKKEYAIPKIVGSKRSLLEDKTWLYPYDITVSTYSYGKSEWIEMIMFKYYFAFLTSTRILNPFILRLKELDISIKDFSRKFLNEFLLKFDIIQKAKATLESNLDKPECDILFADVAPNLPYMSHYSVLKFLILLSPELFFSELKKFIFNNFGEDEIIGDLCDFFQNNINTPMKNEGSPQQKISDIISMCKIWNSDNLIDGCVREAYNTIKQRHS